MQYEHNVIDFEAARRRRLRAMGENSAKSRPARSAPRKLSLVKEDLGALLFAAMLDR